jgi:hypothetical protein
MKQKKLFESLIRTSPSSVRDCEVDIEVDDDDYDGEKKTKMK